MIATRLSGLREIIVRPPADLASQLVFRGEFERNFATGVRDDLAFRFCRDASSFFRLARPLKNVLPRVQFMKGCLKLMTARRSFYCVARCEEIVHYGWTTRGLCRHYRVEPDAVVIGPIWTSPTARGLGIATFATQLAINELVRQGRRLIYIDTSADNLPCLKVIEKCGFGDPAATYLRASSS